MGCKLNFIVFGFTVFSCVMCDDYLDGITYCENLLTSLQNLEQEEHTQNSDVDNAIIYVKRKCNEFKDACRNIQILSDIKLLTINKDRIQKVLDIAKELPDLDQTEEEMDVLEIIKMCS